LKGKLRLNSTSITSLEWWARRLISLLWVSILTGPRSILEQSSESRAEFQGVCASNSLKCRTFLMLYALPMRPITSLAGESIHFADCRLILSSATWLGRYMDRVPAKVVKMPESARPLMGGTQRILTILPAEWSLVDHHTRLRRDCVVLLSPEAARGRTYADHSTGTCYRRLRMACVRCNSCSMDVITQQGIESFGYRRDEGR
jgi:hypothetical protein